MAVYSILVLAVACSAGMAVWLGATEANIDALAFIASATIAVFLLAIVSPVLLARSEYADWRRSVVFGGLVVFISISSLNPSAHYHVFDFSKEIARRTNLRAAVAFLHDQPNLPIYFSGEAARLDFYAGFSYGYALLDNGLDYPEIRMTDNPDVVEAEGGYFIENGCPQVIGEFDEWPLVEFGEPGNEHCVSIARTLPPAAAEHELEMAAAEAHEAFSLEALDRYIDAAASAHNFDAFVEALSLMTTRFPEHVPSVQASGLILAEKEAMGDQGGTDLLTIFTEEPDSWILGDKLNYQLIEDEDGASIRIYIDNSSDEPQTISFSYPLRAETAYVLEMSMRSFAPFDLVRFPSEIIPDSYTDGWGRLTDWTDVQIVFVTPAWPNNQRVIEIELARIYDRGDIWFRELRLIAVDAND